MKKVWLPILAAAIVILPSLISHIHGQEADKKVVVEKKDTTSDKDTTADSKADTDSRGSEGTDKETVKTEEKKTETDIPGKSDRDPDQEKKSGKDKRGIAAENISFSLGVKVLYTWWQPPFSRVDFFGLKSGSKVKMSQGLLFGPVFSIRISPQWSLSAVMTYGKFITKVADPIPNLMLLDMTLGLNAFLSSKVDFGKNEVHRFNAEMTAGKRLGKYFKFFFGIKYNGFFLDMTYLQAFHVDLHTAGPRMGFGASYPVIASKLYIQGNVIAMLMAGTGGKSTALSSGVDAGLNLAYYVNGMRTTIVLGGSFQYLKYLMLNVPLFKNDVEMLYGITLSLIYSF